MTLLVLGGFVTLVLALAWIARQQGRRVNGCCAPSDPRDDLRMRAAFDDDPPNPSADSRE